MSQWFRMYSEVLDDPKVQRLPANLFKMWINLMCLAARGDGILPCVEDIAFSIRMPVEHTLASINQLIVAGLLDDNESVLSPHNWNVRQFQSDVSNERVKRYRERQRNAQCNVTSAVTVTPPEAEADTDTESDAVAASRTPAREPSEIHEIGKEVLRLMGVSDDPRWLGNFSRVEAWLRSGADPEADIFPTITRLMASKQGNPPRSLRYFDAAISDAVRDRTNPLPSNGGGARYVPTPHPNSPKAAFDRLDAELAARRA